MEYQSPGFAASNAMELFLTQQAAQKRQAMLDDMQMQTQRAEIEKGQALLAERKQKHADDLEEKERTNTLTEVGRMKRGDIPPAELIARAKKHYIEIPYQDMAPVPGTTEGPGPIAPDSLTPWGSRPPLDTPQGAMTPGVRLYAGDQKQQDAAILKTQVKDLIDEASGLEQGTPEFNNVALQYNMLTGKTIPAGWGKPAVKPNVMVLRQSTHDPKAGIERHVDNGTPNGIWVPYNGDAPPDAHWITEQPAPDHSVQIDGQRLSAWQQAQIRIDKMAVAPTAHRDTINDLGVMLNQNTPQADALIAPMLLKATVSGAGTGFRMTQSEINQVIGAKSNWIKLEMALKQWSLDPLKARKFDETQQLQMRQLARAIRAKAVKQLAAQLDLQDSINYAKTPDEIHLAMTAWRRKELAEDADPAYDSNDPTTQGDVPKSKYSREPL